MGNDGYFTATSSSAADRCRCCQSGERRPGSRRGSSRARARALAEPRGEQRRAADLLGDELVDLVGLEDDDVAAGRLGVGVGDADHDAVVGGHRLAVDAVALAEPGVDRQRPRCVHRGAVGRVDHQPPVAELVAEPLDEQGGVAGQDVGGLELLVQVADEVAGRPLVEAVSRASCSARRARHRAELAGEGADGRAELGGSAQGVALPERQPSRDAGGGGHQHPVVGDVLDPPAGGAEREDVADARLVDHLLVELADPLAGPLGAHEEDAEEAAVGDRAAAGHREALGARSAGEGAGDAVPDDRAAAARRTRRRGSGR